MSPIETIETMWENDCMIDPTNLITSQIQTPILHAKYIRKLNEAKQLLRQKIAMKDKLVILKTDYYSGNLAKETLDKYGWKQFQRVVLIKDVPAYLNADDDIIMLNTQVSECHDLVDMITDILKQLSNRGYAIKNIIDYEKFLHGR